MMDFVFQMMNVRISNEGNYGRLEEASSSGTVGQDLSLEIARAGWNYDTADFVYAKKSKGIQGVNGGAHGMDYY